MSAPQSVRDALADAETLKRIASEYYGAFGNVGQPVYRNIYHAEWCALWALRTLTSRYASLAAQAAFRAVPGLRGAQ